jgi:uncharacterized OB-fold protein
VSLQLRAPLEIGFDYTRSLGPTLGAFMTALAERRILGSRGADGRVHAPPVEYDPITAAPTAELVEVSDVGTVVTWSWMPEPLDGQPLAEPFAWALIRLDGADTPMLHAVDAGSADRMRSGMRVRTRWAEHPVGHIRDIVCFEPEVSALASESSALASARADPGAIQTASSLVASLLSPDAAGPGAESSALASARADPGAIQTASSLVASLLSPDAAGPGAERVTMITTPIRLRYEHAASPEESRYLRGLADGRLVGQRCPACAKVYIPPRGACPTDGVPTTEEVELPDRGTVTTFCVVNVPFPGQRLKPPYVVAYVLLDGADIAFLHLVHGCAAGDVRMGMRVRAVWRPRDEWGPTLQNIAHFEPSGEPDAPFETYARHL